MNKTNVAIVLAVLLGVSLAIADQAHGQARRWRGRAARALAPPSATVRARRTPGPAGPVYRYAYPSSYYDPSYYYPRYTGAFHARYFDDIPSLYGTRPMRGTAW